MVAADHAESRAPFGMAVGLRQVGPRDQAVAVFHQPVPREAQHRSRAGRRPEQTRIGAGGRGMGGVRALPAPE